MDSKRYPIFMRAIALAVALSFFAQELVFAAPAEGPAPVLSPLETILTDPARFEAPLDVTVLKEVHRGTNGALIIHIEDAHSNLSGQENLAAALDEIMKKYGVMLVLREGGSQEGTLTPIKELAPPDVWKRVAKNFLIQGEISGEEYLNLVSDHPMKIMGVEDRELYIRNLGAYADLAGQREAILASLGIIRAAAEKLKKKLFPEELLRYEKLGGPDGFEARFAMLVDLAHASDVSLNEFPELRKLSALQESERRIDFKLANLEHAALMEEIDRRGGGSELGRHLDRMRGMKNQKLAQFAYFQNTLNLAREKGISPEKYPNWFAHTGYLREFSAVDLEAALDEMDRLEDRLYLGRLASPESRLLRSVDQHVKLLQTAYRVQMSTKEFERYKQDDPALGTVPYLAFLNRKLAEMGYFSDLVPYESRLETGKTALTAFYEFVTQRDLMFVRNIERVMNEENSRAATLITGGYHTAHLKKLLRERGYSYAVLTPIVTSETNQAKYEKMLLEPIMKDKKTVEMGAGKTAGVWLRAAGARDYQPRLNRIIKGAADAADASPEKRAEVALRLTRPGAVPAGVPTGARLAQEGEPKPERKTVWQWIKHKLGFGEAKKRESAKIPERKAVPGAGEKPEAVRDSPGAFEYSDPDQDFSGVDLEHFVHAQYQLARRLLTDAQITKILGITEKGPTEELYRKIYERLADGKYTKEIVDAINEGTYADPRLAIEIVGQNPNPRAQGVYEAIANSLDALGLKIGQFGKGVKQIIDWLEPTGQDRIDVFTKKKGEEPYQLTILKSPSGQSYIQVRKISQSSFHSAAGESLEHGTAVKVTVKNKIPADESQTDEKRRNSQKAIAEGIGKRFPFVTAVKITTETAGDAGPHKVNGFEEKAVIAPAGVPPYSPAESEGKNIRVEILDRTITVVDNGHGMDAEVISRMFVPKEGTKQPEPLAGPAVEAELGKVKVVHDKSLPHRVSFSRNGEVVVAVDIPESLQEGATSPGGLMVEFGRLLDVPESRDQIVIPLDLKPGELSNFQRAVERAVAQVAANPSLPDTEKVKFINTIVVGLDGLVRGNENYAHVVKSIRVSVAKILEPVIERLYKEGFTVLPHDRQYAQLALPPDKAKVIHFDERLFNWQGAVSLKALGGTVVPGITLGGEKRLPLVVIPFKEEAVKGIRAFDPLWHEWPQDQRIPMIKTDRFIAIPLEIGKRLAELAQKNLGGLTAEEDLEFKSLLQRVSVITAEEVPTSYEVAKPKENLVLAPRTEIQKSIGEIDSDAVNSFLTAPPVVLPEAPPAPGRIPADANYRVGVTPEGRLIDIESGRVSEDGVKEVVPLGHGHYKIVYTAGSAKVVQWDTEKGVIGKSIGNLAAEKNIHISPDKRFIFFNYGNRVDPVLFFEVETGKWIFPDSGFMSKPPQLSEAPFAKKTQVQFSRDGKYMVYVEEGLKGNQLLQIVDLIQGLNSRTVPLGPGKVEYRLSSYNENIAFLKASDGSTALIDLREPKMNLGAAEPSFTKDPHFDLIIDVRDPDKPVATDPVTGREFTYEGEIIRHDRETSSLWTFNNGEVWRIYYEEIAPGDLRRTEHPYGGDAIYDKVPARFLVSRSSIGGLILVDLRTPGVPYALPVGYAPLLFDGKYFVLRHPKTGEFIYLDPEKPAEPVVVRPGPPVKAATGLVKPSDATDAPSHYPERLPEGLTVVSRRGGFLVLATPGGQLIYHRRNAGDWNIASPGEFTEYRVIETGNAVILKRPNGKYALFDLSIRDTVIADADHIEVDPSGTLAIGFRNGRFSDLKHLRGGQAPIDLPEGADVLSMQIASDERYVYFAIAASGEKKGMIAIYDKRGGPPKHLQTFGFGDDLAELRRPLFWQQYYPVSKKVVKRQAASLNFFDNVPHPSLTPYKDAPPTGPYGLDRHLMGSAMLEVRKISPVSDEDQGSQVVLEDLELGTVKKFELRPGEVIRPLEGEFVWAVEDADGRMTSLWLPEMPPELNEGEYDGRVNETRSAVLIEVLMITGKTGYLLMNKGGELTVPDIPEGFEPTDVNGEYFVLKNSKTGEVLYLDPRKPARAPPAAPVPAAPPAPARQPGKPSMLSGPAMKSAQGFDELYVITREDLAHWKNAIRHPASGLTTYESKVEFSASRRFIVSLDKQGLLYAYKAGTKDTMILHEVPIGREDYRVVENADAVILKRRDGKYDLFSLPLGKILIEGADHIEIDSPGLLAVAVYKDALFDVSLQSGKKTDISSEVLLTTVDDEFIYILTERKGSKTLTKMDRKTGRWAQTIPLKDYHEALPSYWEGYSKDRKSIMELKGTVWQPAVVHRLTAEVSFRGNEPTASFRDSLTLQYGRIMALRRRDKDPKTPTYDLSMHDLKGKGYGIPGFNMGHFSNNLKFEMMHQNQIGYQLSTEEGREAVLSGSKESDEWGPERKRVPRRHFETIVANKSRTFLLARGQGRSFVVDFEGNPKDVTGLIPQDFVPAESNGDYFAFVHPLTGEVRLLDPGLAPPEKPEAPKVDDAERIHRALERWEKEVKSRRDEWVAEARAAFRPYLDLIPEEYRPEAKKQIRPFLEKLYQDQDGEIRKRFAAAAEGEPIDLTTPLPFAIFAQRMSALIGELGPFLQNAKRELAQEEETARRNYYSHLFWRLFYAAVEPEADLSLLSGKALHAVALGWDIDEPYKRADIGVIVDLVNAVQTREPLDLEVLMHLLSFLSEASRMSLDKHRILIAQLKRLMAQKSLRYLAQFKEVFKKAAYGDLVTALHDPQRLTDLNLGDVRPFVVFLTNEVEPVRTKDRSPPDGADVAMPEGGAAVSQIAKLEQSRPKSGADDVVMGMNHLLGHLGKLPDPDVPLEAEILRNTTVQRESGAYTAEIAQNSHDATQGMNGELVVDFYLQKGPEGAEEYVEEARDNGTGALREVALLIPKSTKAAAAQKDLTGFFGTGKYTIFEGADRVEILTKNKDRAYQFMFSVLKEGGVPVAIRLSGIREVKDPKVRQGVTVRRIKAAGNTIPELDQMLAQRAWKTFAGLAQRDDFSISFIDHEGKKQPLEVKKELLSETPFKAARPGEDTLTDFGAMRLYNVKDMPLQSVDRIGLRVGEIKEEYLALIPASLRPLVKELGLVIQIPLPLIRGRSAFEHEHDYLPVIQKYVAAEFYKAIAYKTLTQSSPQFVFEGFPLDWETNDHYWDSINLQQDEKVLRLAEKINAGRYDEILPADMQALLTERGKLDKAKKFVKLILLLQTVTDWDYPTKRMSLIGRRIAVQRETNKARAEAQRRMLDVPEAAIPPVREIAFFASRVEQATGIALAHEQMKYPERYAKEPETPGEKRLVEVAEKIAVHFGLDGVVLMKPEVEFAGAFKDRKMYISSGLAWGLGVGDPDKGFLDKASDTVVHELAHYLEELMAKGASGLNEGEIFVADLLNFTHDAVGTFAEAMKYVAAVSLANHDKPVGARLAEKTVREITSWQDLSEVLARVAGEVSQGFEDRHGVYLQRLSLWVRQSRDRFVLADRAHYDGSQYPEDAVKWMTGPLLAIQKNAPARWQESVRELALALPYSVYDIRRELWGIAEDIDEPNQATRGEAVTTGREFSETLRGEIHGASFSVLSALRTVRWYLEFLRKGDVEDPAGGQFLAWTLRPRDHKVREIYQRVPENRARTEKFSQLEKTLLSDGSAGPLAEAEWVRRRPVLHAALQELENSQADARRDALARVKRLLRFYELYFEKGSVYREDIIKPSGRPLIFDGGKVIGLTPEEEALEEEIRRFLDSGLTEEDKEIGGVLYVDHKIVRPLEQLERMLSSIQEGSARDDIFREWLGHSVVQQDPELKGALEKLMEIPNENMAARWRAVLETRRALRAALEKSGEVAGRIDLYHLNRALDQLFSETLSVLYGSWPAEERVRRSALLIKEAVEALYEDGQLPRYVLPWAGLLDHPELTNGQMANVLGVIREAMRRAVRRWVEPYEAAARDLFVEDAAAANRAVGILMKEQFVLRSAEDLSQKAEEAVKAKGRPSDPVFPERRAAAEAARRAEPWRGIVHLDAAPEILPALRHAQADHGGKGSYLLHLSAQGLPVPSGFILDSGIFRSRSHLSHRDTFRGEVLKHVSLLEKEWSAKADRPVSLGDPEAPLFLSVRSGSAFIMPGIVGTVIDLGFTPAVLEKEKSRRGEKAALIAFTRFIESVGVMLNVPDDIFQKMIADHLESAGAAEIASLSAEQLKKLDESLIGALRERGLEADFRRLFEDPREQVLSAIDYVDRSWESPNAVGYRATQGLSHDWRTPVIVQAYVFGDADSRSGTGLARSHDAAGRPRIGGDWLHQNQGYDIAQGRAAPSSLEKLSRDEPRVYRELEEAVRQTSNYWGAPTLSEFTVEKGRLWFLQTNLDLAAEAGEVFPALALDPSDKEIGAGVVVYGSGGVRGWAVSDIQEAMSEGTLARLKEAGGADGVVVVSRYLSPGSAAHYIRADEILKGMGKRLVILSGGGGTTSHAAVVAQSRRIPAIVGAGALPAIPEGALVSLDLGTGKIYTRPAGTTEGARLAERIEEELAGIAEDPEGRKAMVKLRVWLFKKLKEMNASSRLFRTNELPDLYAGLVKALRKKIFVVEFGPGRYILWEDGGSGSTKAAHEWEKVTNGLVRSQGDIERKKMILDLTESWMNEYTIDTGGSSEFRQEMLTKFNADITKQYPSIKLSATNVSSRRIEWVRVLLKLLPPSILASENTTAALRGGIDLRAGRHMATRIGHYDEQYGVLGVQPTILTPREFAEVFLHEFGHVLEGKHLRDPVFRALQKRAQGEMYQLPALGFSGQERARRIHDPSEFFAETFMHYVLHGRHMREDFKVPGTKNAELWRAIHNYYRERVFGGVEYGVVDGRLTAISGARLAASREERIRENVDKLLSGQISLEVESRMKDGEHLILGLADPDGRLVLTVNKINTQLLRERGYDVNHLIDFNIMQKTGIEGPPNPYHIKLTPPSKIILYDEEIRRRYREGFEDFEYILTETFDRYNRAKGFTDRALDRLKRVVEGLPGPWVVERGERSLKATLKDDARALHIWVFENGNWWIGFIATDPDIQNPVLEIAGSPKGIKIGGKDWTPVEIDDPNALYAIEWSPKRKMLDIVLEDSARKKLRTAKTQSFMMTANHFTFGWNMGVSRRDWERLKKAQGARLAEGALNGGVWKVLHRSREVDVYEVEFQGKQIHVISEMHETVPAEVALNNALENAAKDPASWFYLIEGDLHGNPIFERVKSKLGGIASLPDQFDPLPELVKAGVISLDEARLALGIFYLDMIGKLIQHGIDLRAIEKKSPFKIASEAAATTLTKDGLATSPQDVLSLLSRDISRHDQIQDAINSANHVLRIALDAADIKGSEITKNALQGPQIKFLVRIGKAHLRSLISTGEIAAHTQALIPTNEPDIAHVRLAFDVQETIRNKTIGEEERRKSRIASQTKRFDDSIKKFEDELERQGLSKDSNATAMLNEIKAGYHWLSADLAGRYHEFNYVRSHEMTTRVGNILRIMESADIKKAEVVSKILLADDLRVHLFLGSLGEFSPTYKKLQAGARLALVDGRGLKSALSKEEKSLTAAMEGALFAQWRNFRMSQPHDIQEIMTDELLTELSGAVAAGLYRTRRDTLEDLHRSGILPPDLYGAVAGRRTVPSGLSDEFISTLFNMILEYRRQGFTDRQTEFFVKRLIPLSAIKKWMNDTNLTHAEILVFLMGNPRDPLSAVERYQRNIERLSKRYEEELKEGILTPSIVAHFARSNPLKSEAAIETFLAEVRRLMGKFKTYLDQGRISVVNIVHTVLLNPKDAEKSIELALTTAPLSGALPLPVPPAAGFGTVPAPTAAERARLKALDARLDLGRAGTIRFSGDLPSVLLEVAGILARLEAVRTNVQSSIRESIVRQTRLIRAEKEMSLNDLSLRSGLGFPVLASLEEGTYSSIPSRETQGSIAVALGVKMEDLAPQRPEDLSLDQERILEEALSEGRRIFGKYLSVTAEAYGLKYTALERASGVPNSYISQSALGRIEMSVESAVNLAGTVATMAKDKLPQPVWRSLDQGNLLAATRVVDEKMGQEIRARRIAKKMPIRELAEKAGITAGAMSSLELGYGGTRSPETLRKIAAVLGESEAGLSSAWQSEAAQEKFLADRFESRVQRAREAYEQLRGRSGEYSFPKLAEKTGLSSSMLAYLEDGHEKIYPAYVPVLAAGLDVPVNRLWQEEDLVVIRFEAPTALATGAKPQPLDGARLAAMDEKVAEQVFQGVLKRGPTAEEMKEVQTAFDSRRQEGAVRAAGTVANRILAQSPKVGQVVWGRIRPVVPGSRYEIGAFRVTEILDGLSPESSVSVEYHHPSLNKWIKDSGRWDFGDFAWTPKEAVEKFKVSDKDIAPTPGLEEAAPRRFRDIFGARLSQALIGTAQAAEAIGTRDPAALLLIAQGLLSPDLPKGIQKATPFEFYNVGNGQIRAFLSDDQKSGVVIFYAPDDEDKLREIARIDLTEAMIREAEKARQAAPGIAVRETIEASEALKAFVEDQKKAQFARQVYAKAGAGNRMVVLRVATPEKLRDEKVELYTRQMDTLRSIVGPNVLLQFVRIGDDGRTEIYGPSDIVPDKRDQYEMIYLSELSEGALKAAQFDEAGFASVEGLAKDETIIPFVAETVFLVATARLSGVTLQIQQLWHNVRSDPMRDLDPAAFNDVKKVTVVDLGRYARLSLKIITRIALEKVLEYTRLALQAIGAAA